MKKQQARRKEALGNSLASYLETTLSSDALTKTDATKYVDEAFEAMKQAGGLE